MREIEVIVSSMRDGKHKDVANRICPTISRDHHYCCVVTQYHILIIIADGEMTVPDQTTKAIVEASKWPLSIIVVGVGDGPWEEMKRYDDGLPERRFDNFQFVNYTGITENADNADPDRAFALHALMEIPDQFGAILNLGMLNWD
jgi:E3 ubiquitin-protein ligase RGLG